MDKKASGILDMFVIMGMLVLIGVALFASLKLMNVTVDSGIFADDAAADKSVNLSRTTILSFDNLMLFIIIGLSLVVIVSSAFVWNHPAFFFVGLILLGIAITVAGIVSNSFFNLASNDNIADLSASFPKLQFFMDNLPIYVAFLGLTALVVGMVAYTKQ